MHLRADSFYAICSESIALNGVAANGSHRPSDNRLRAPVFLGTRVISRWLREEPGCCSLSILNEIDTAMLRLIPPHADDAIPMLPLQRTSSHSAPKLRTVMELLDGTSPTRTSPGRRRRLSCHHFGNRCRTGAGFVVRCRLRYIAPTSTGTGRAISIPLRHDQVHRLQMLRGGMQRTEWKPSRYSLFGGWERSRAAYIRTRNAAISRWVATIALSRLA